MVDSNEGPVSTEAEMSKQQLTVSVVSGLWNLMKFLIEFLGLEVCNDIPAKFLGVPEFFGWLSYTSLTLDSMKAYYL